MKKQPTALLRKKVSAGSPATLQVSCVQLHWAKPLAYNLRRLHVLTSEAATVAAETGDKHLACDDLLPARLSRRATRKTK